ncbi:MAG: glutathione S-transferase family protein [Rhodospirillaceae bacterium]|nr:glutathione S-transferase family protein [Rhodospirillaceae bacterium]
MALKLYELSGVDDNRFSPFCWRVRLALAHKGLDAETVPLTFGQKDKLTFSGQDRVPVLVDGDAIVSDSWQIACYLEDAYPDRSSLFGGDIGRGEALFLNAWADTVVAGGIVPLVVRDILNCTEEVDKAYFRTSREARLGKALEAVEAERDGRLPGFRSSLQPLRMVLEQQPFVAGDGPAYADYIFFGLFQWARLTSPYALLAADDPIYAWRDRMLGLFDGLASEAKGFPL